MTKKMLIDATHGEETRVAVIDDGRLEEFEYESAFRKPLKGNIFLAKVTRVEPSLQAAFVNYGGNRHGFLPFSEIHPDYFRIPVSDREALIAEQEEALREHDEAEEQEVENTEENVSDESADDGSDVETIDDAVEDVEEVGGEIVEDVAGDQADEENAAEEGDDDNIGNRVEDEEENDVNGNVASSEDSEEESGNRGNRRGGRGRGRGGRGRGRGRHAAHRSKRVESFGGEDADDEKRFRFNLRRKYKIQEVIKRGQIMLVQVSKEERGNKGAAVSSYLSLPGRYCVLMPNSPRAGGVSRKISNYKDRAKMRDMMKELEVPRGMSVILRTAGVTRTKTEVKRDLDYLMRLWDNIRSLTLESSAPALVYEEANLIKRAVRDLYTRDVEEIAVAGEGGYKTAKNFMKMMIPSHAKRVVEYKEEDKTLFNKYKVEEQIADIGETTVTLKSGGYLIINPTEALVSIDVNSGKATKERHIEETALKTNLEAAEEVARQLRLRDLGGLVVIDFIDMEDRRNNGKVERKMREALSSDKARIQMGRISSFGLMEMSRQRMSASLGESQFETCPHCEGTGRIRTADAASILVLRDIEAEGIKGRAAEIMVHVPANVAIYILNYKRQNLSDLEARYDVRIVLRVDDDLNASSSRVEVSKPKSKKTNDDDGEDEDRGNDAKRSKQDSDDSEKSEGRGRRRGRRGGRRRNNNRDERNENDVSDDVENLDQNVKDSTEDGKEKPKRRPRRSSKKADNASEADVKTAEAPEAEASEENKPKKRGRKPAAKKADEAVASEETVSKEETKSVAKRSAKKSKASNDDTEEVKAKKNDEPKDYEIVNAAPKKKKKGWWSRG